MAYVIANWWYVVADVVAIVRAVVTRRHSMVTRSIRINVTVNRRWRRHGQIREVEHIRVYVQGIRRYS